MKTTIVVSEGDEHATFTSKRAMCDAFGWDYRKFRGMKGVPSKVGRYRLRKCEDNVSIPCKRLRFFLEKAVEIQDAEFSEAANSVLVYELRFRGTVHYTVEINIHTGEVVKVKDQESEEFKLDNNTRDLLYNKMIQTHGK